MISNTEMTAIAALDLEPIKAKLMHKASGEGWSLARATAVETEYRRFLFLMKMFPHEETAPLVDVDTFWHYHILDTMKYAADCDTVFGAFLHHFPYIGMRGENDEEVRLSSGQRMRELYEETFGESYDRAAAAYCAVPPPAAYCAIPPSVSASGNGATAYCAIPPSIKASARSATAYCAIPPSVKASTTAYCAIPPSVKASTTAYCAIPPSVKASTTAYCAIPPKAAGLNTGTAYCARINNISSTAMAARAATVVCA